MSARLVRHGELLPPMPDTWRCLICRGPQRKEDGAPCERCGGWLHFLCYWPECLTAAERAAFADAQAVDAPAPRRRVRVQAGARRFEFDTLVGPSAVEDFLNRQIVLCSGCRS